MNLQWIITPLIGCVIGWITNDIAVRMLFHPRKPLYFGKFRIPFTPGLIPAQKERIARSIGLMVSDKLLNIQTFRENLLSPDMRDKLKLQVIRTLERFSQDERTLTEMLASRDYICSLINVMQEKITEYIKAKSGDGTLGTLIAGKVSAKFQRMSGGLFGRTIFESAASDVISSLLNVKLGELIPNITAEILESIKEDILSMRVCDIYNREEKYITVIAEKATEILFRVMEEHAPSILDAVNIMEIVTARIQTFSPEQLENIVFGVMNRELKAIVRLGALLGFIMGCVNLIASLI